MSIIRGAGFKNDSCESRAIGAAFRLAECRWKACLVNRAEMAILPAALQFSGFIYGLFLQLRLRSAVKKLIVVLKTDTFTTDALLSILVGEFLYKVGQFEEAAKCFGKALEILDEPDQNIRISALVGKLECKIARQEYLWRSGNLDPRSAREARELIELIQKDLHAVSRPLQVELDRRLMCAKSAMDVLVSKIKLHCDETILKRLGFL